MRTGALTVGLVAVVLIAGGDADGQRTPPDAGDLDKEIVRRYIKRASARLKFNEGLIGTWSGKAKWTDCSVRGAAKLQLEIAPTLTSDGSLVMDGLGSIAWGATEDGLAFSGGGMEITFTPGKKAAKLVFKSDAGCVGKATLKRPTSGMASCDSLRALATIEASCEGLPAETRDDDLTRVTEAWRGWRKLKGKKKKKRAKVCAAEVETLRADLLMPCRLGPPPGETGEQFPGVQYPFHVDPPDP